MTISAIIDHENLATQVARWVACIHVLVDDSHTGKGIDKLACLFTPSFRRLIQSVELREQLFQENNSSGLSKPTRQGFRRDVTRHTDTRHDTRGTTPSETENIENLTADTLIINLQAIEEIDCVQ